MCVSKHEVRPGLTGMLDHIDTLLAVKSKVTILLDLIVETPLSHDGKSNFTDNEVCTLAGMIGDLLDDAWAASDGIYKIWREEIKHEKGGVA